MRSLLLAALLLLSHAAFAQGSCEDATLKREFEATWPPRIRAAQGNICQGLRVTEQMWTAQRATISRCFVGQTRQDLLVEIDRQILDARQGQSQSCTGR